jgi:OOP family OmpA-OmpF porin
MKTNKLILAAALFGATVSVASAAPAGFNPWYVGVDVGQSRIDLSSSQVDSDAARAGITTRNTTVDNTDTGWKLSAGYQFNPNFALEGGYVDLGKVGFSTTVTAVNGSAVTPTKLNGDWKISQGFYLDAVGSVPVSDRFVLFGKLGAYNLKTEFTASANGASASDSTRNTNLTYGLGVGYSLNDKTLLRASWERFSKVGDENKTGQGDVDLLSLGVAVKF